MRVDAVDEAADTVVSEDRVRRKGDSRGGGGGVGGGDMLERLELTAESLSLSSSVERRPEEETLLLTEGGLYSKLRSDLVGDVMLSREAGASAEFLGLGNEGRTSSRLELEDNGVEDPYTVRLFLLKAGEYLGKLVVLLLVFQGGEGITRGVALLAVV